MDNDPSEELARQRRVAFAAAFPAQAQTTTQSTQASIPADEKNSCGYCKRPISEFLMTKLRSAAACPACTTNAMINTTKNIQQRLTDRGGAFASKEQRTEHNKIKHDWRFVKITLANGIAKWEALLGDADVLPEDSTNIKRALETWDKHKFQMSKVPGVRYDEKSKAKEPTEEEHEVARLTMELLRLILEKEMAAEEEATQSTSTKRAEEDALRDSQAEMCFARQTRADGNEIPVAQEVKASTPPPTASAPGTPKSILKRKASTALPRTPSQKRIRIADTVTISPPRLNVSNPSPFTALPDTVTTQTHAEHTSAQRNCKRTSFKRSAPNYLPGVWASGAFEEKARTSNYKKSWDNTVLHVEEELFEAEYEQELFGIIKAIAGAWVGMWWIRNVTRHIGLEQLEEGLILQ